MPPENEAPECERGGRAIPLRRPRLLDQVREAIRTRHYSRRTEAAHVGWIRRFILYHQKRHPAEMGEVEVAAFLTHLAVEQRVSASTQNQALSALLFLYRVILKRDLDLVVCLEGRSVREREFHCAEEVEMDIPRNTKLGIFEVVVFEVCE